MATVRVKSGISAVVFRPSGETIVLAEGVAFDDSDPIVKDCAWAFGDDATDVAKTRRRSSVLIESADRSDLR